MSRITYDLTEHDFMAYARYHFRYSADARASRNRLLFFGTIALAVFAYGIKDDPNFGLARPAMYALRLVLTVTVFGGLYGIYFFLVRPNVMRGWLKTAMRKMLGKTTLELRDDGIHVNKADGKGRLKWSELREIVETSEYLYLIMGPLRAFVIPRRAFADAQECAAFLAHLHREQRAAAPAAR